MRIAIVAAGLVSALAIPVAAPVAVAAEPPAKELFGRVSQPSAPLGAMRSIGGYARGCLAGGVALPTDGPNWQVMRLARNRNWGHPSLVAAIQRIARAVPQVSDWPGLLIGDMAQPRGGPATSGHVSHQTGLDVDIWLTPMPTRRLSADERQSIAAPDVVAVDGDSVNPAMWTPSHAAVIRAAARDPAVERVLVSAAIKRELCRQAGPDRAWLSKVRPWYQHRDHMHVRLVCPPDAQGCTAQAPPPPGDGCDASLTWWFTDEAKHPKPGPPGQPITLAQLPAACRAVVTAP